MDLGSACGAISLHMRDALLVVAPCGTIRWSNDRFADRFGCREHCAPGDAQALLRAPVLGMSLAQMVRAKGTVALDREGLPYSLCLLMESEGALLLALLPIAVAEPEHRNEVDASPRCPDAPARACRMRVEELEAELTQANADYRRLADTVETLVVRYDRARRRTYVNRIFEEFHGKTAATSLGRSPLDLPANDAPHVADVDEKIARVIATGASFTIDRDYVDSRGRHICCTERIVPEYDVNGAISGALLVAFGRYEEHAAKAAQREAEAALSEIFDNIGSAIALSEAEAARDYRIVSVNRAFERLLGTPAFALVGKLSRELREVSYGGALDAFRHACIATNSPQMRTIGVGASGQRGGRVIDVRFFPSLERFPGRQRVIEIYRDVTEDHYAQTHLRTLLDLSPSLIFGVSSGGAITFVSPAVCSRLGGSCDDYLGRNLIEVIATFAPDACRPLTRAIQRAGGGDSDAFEVSVEATDGPNWLAFMTFAEPRSEDAPESDLLLVVRDVTSLRAVENKLRATNTKLRQLRLERELSVEDERKRIAHELHDELGQQLTALRYSVQNLGRLCGDGPPPVIDSLTQIDALIDGALQSVRNVVRKLRPPALDVGLVPAVQGLIEQLFGSGEIDCDLTVTPRSLSLDDYHSLHTFRCIQEALTNVVRHSCATLAYVDIRKTDSEISVRVGDNGKGFEQTSVRDSNGLSGMHERARLLGGRAFIHSRVGTGTEVILAYRERSTGAQDGE